MRIVTEYIAALVSLAVLDALWLTLTKSFYLSQIGSLFADKIAWWAVVLFYLLYAAAIVYFLGGTSSVQSAVLSGAVLGFTAYMTYDLVNAATLPLWPVRFFVVDIAWGTVITAAASAAAFWASKFL